jgi:PLP dependent protein
LREWRDVLVRGFPDQDLSTLSMGMTNDFEWAIEEGSTLVRIGTALFEGFR